MIIPPTAPPNLSAWDSSATPPDRAQLLKDYQAFNADLSDLEQALASHNTGAAELALGRLATLLNPSSSTSFYAAAHNDPAIQPTLNYMQGMTEAMNEEFEAGNDSACALLAGGAGMQSALQDLFQFITKD